MSLSVSNNTISQQRLLQKRQSVAERAGGASEASTPRPAQTASGSTAGALTGGRPALTSDLLATLLQEQAKASAPFTDSVTVPGGGQVFQ